MSTLQKCWGRNRRLPKLRCICWGFCTCANRSRKGHLYYYFNDPNVCFTPPYRFLTLLNIYNYERDCQKWANQRRAFHWFTLPKKIAKVRGQNIEIAKWFLWCPLRRGTNIPCLTIFQTQLAFCEWENQKNPLRFSSSPGAQGIDCCITNSCHYMRNYFKKYSSQEKKC